MKTTLKKNHTVLTRSDLAALLLCAGLFGYLFWAAGRGIDTVDESFYYTIAQRLLQGDRFLVDEWHVSQFSAVFQLLPYRLCAKLTGGEGTLLALRYLYLCVDLILYWYFYLKLRAKKAWGALAAALFCSFVFFGLYTFSYYTMCPQALAVMGMLLFVDDRRSPPRLLFAGLLLACAVLIEPTLTLVYAAYSVLVLIRAVRKRKGRAFLDAYAFAVNGRVWGYLTATAALCAAAFLIYLVASSGFSAILANLPEMFTDTEYQFGWYGNGMNPIYLRYMLEYYDAVPLVALALMPVLCGVLKKRCGARANTVLFLIAGVLLLLCYAAAARRMLADRTRILMFMQFQTVPLLLFGPVPYILIEKKDRRVFAFWCLGFASSLSIDYFSEIIFGYGGSLTYFSAVLCTVSYLAERKELLCAANRTDKKSRKAAPARALPIAAAALAALLLCCETGKIFVAANCDLVETAYNASSDRRRDAKLDRGPLKGVRTTAAHKEKYDAELDDLDIVRQNCGGAFYVAGIRCCDYLYADLPIAAYSTAYNEDEDVGRQERYWALHPDKRPAYVYIPFYHFLTFEDTGTADGRLAYFERLCVCEVTRGKAGYLVKVDAWR
ncbi:MAG: hypothetical protein IJL26_00330 [Clostridia bacterium]|nr:hypothetical protein [Clostridia bacterium]